MDALLQSTLVLLQLGKMSIELAQRLIFPSQLHLCLGETLRADRRQSYLSVLIISYNLCHRLLAREEHRLTEKESWVVTHQGLTNFLQNFYILAN